MTTKKQEDLFKRMLGVIQNRGNVNKFELQDAVGISISTYNQISTYFIHRFQDTLHWIEYDKKEKTFRWVKSSEDSPVESKSDNQN